MVKILFNFIINIGWIILYVFWCKNKLKFINDLNAGNCKLILFGFSLVLYIGSLISSIFGLIYLKKSKNSINDSTCFLTQFFEHFIYGEENMNFPKWVGTNTILKTLSDTNNFIETLNYDEIFSNYEEILSQNQIFITQLNEMITKPIKSPINDNWKFIPKFFYQYNNINNISSTIGQIYYEYDISVIESIDNLTKLKNQFDIINNERENLLNSLNDIYSIFSQLENTIINANDKITDYILKINKKYNNIFIKFGMVLFIFLIIFPSISIISFTFFIFYKIQFTNISIQIFWNFCILICLVSLILGSIFGIISTISLESIPAISYLLSSNYLKKNDNQFNGNEIISNYLDTCLNDDGNLYSKMKISESKLYLIYDLLNISKKVNKQEIKLQYYRILPQPIINAQNDIQNILLDPVYTTDIEINKNEDYQTNLNILNECNEEYIFVFGSCENKLTQDKNCHSIDYSYNPYTLFNDNNCIIKYNLIANSYEELMNELNKINDIFLGLNGKISLSTLYMKVIELLIKIYRKSNSELTNILINIYDKVIGENGKFEDLFNCNNLKYDLIKFFGEFKNYYSKYVYKIYCCFISSSILIFFSTIYTLIDLYDGFKKNKSFSKSVFEFSPNLREQNSQSIYYHKNHSFRNNDTNRKLSQKY